jgi:hypothetical protein
MYLYRYSLVILFLEIEKVLKKRSFPKTNKKTCVRIGREVSQLHFLKYEVAYLVTVCIHFQRGDRKYDSKRHKHPESSNSSCVIFLSGGQKLLCYLCSDLCCTMYMHEHLECGDEEGKINTKIQFFLTLILLELCRLKNIVLLKKKYVRVLATKKFQTKYNYRLKI